MAATTTEQDNITAVEANTVVNDGESVQIKGTIFTHWPSLVYCSLLCIGGFQFGLDLGSIAGIQAMPGFLMHFGYEDPTQTLGYGIDSVVQQLINSLMSIGAFIGCMCIGPIGKFLPRRWTYLIGIVLTYLAVILQIVATNVGTLYAGRLIIGIGNGLFNILPQLYIHESAPAIQRGALLGAFNVFIGIGLLVGAIIDNYCALILNKNAYIIPLGTFFIIPTFILVILFFIPESPRWLIEHGKMEEAHKSLCRLRNKDTHPQLIEAELEEIKEALEAERRLSQGVAIFDLFKGTNLRRTLLSIAMMCCLNGTGALLFLSYGTYFFAIAGQTKAFEESVGMTAAGLVATIFSIWLITRIGRRTILLIGFAMQAICMIITAATSQATLTPTVGRVLVAFTIIFLFFYNMCCAGYIYLVAGEIPTQRLRGYTLGIAVAISFFLSWLVSFTAPYFINPTQLNWGVKYGYIWFGSNVIIFVFIFLFVPETKDRTLEEIDEMFEDRLPARKFKNHFCVRANNARIVGLQHVAGTADKHEVHQVEKA